MQKAIRPALVSTSWLRTVVSSRPNNHRIIDATWHPPVLKRDAAEEFKSFHIPGSQFFDIRKCVDKSSSDSIPFMRAPTSEFESYVGHLGINNDTQVIVYDNSSEFPLFSAQRAWWNFRLYGHDRVCVLDGGMKKWIAENGPTSSAVEKVSVEKFSSNFQPHLIKTYEDIVQNLEDFGFQLVDARPPGRYNGTAPEPAAGVKPGRIPNTTNIPFVTTLDLDNQCLKRPDELRKIFENAGVDLTKSIVATCSVGVTANALVLAAYECGNDQVAVYDGSWSEWYHKAPNELKLNVPSDK